MDLYFISLAKLEQRFSECPSLSLYRTVWASKDILYKIGKVEVELWLSCFVVLFFNSWKVGVVTKHCWNSGTLLLLCSPPCWPGQQWPLPDPPAGAAFLPPGPDAYLAAWWKAPASPSPCLSFLAVLHIHLLFPAACGLQVPAPDTGTSILT